jgi:hypothetical protein
MLPLVWMITARGPAAPWALGVRGGRVCPQVSIGRATRQTLLATFRSPTRSRLRANPQANGGDLRPRGTFWSA